MSAADPSSSQHDAPVRARWDCVRALYPGVGGVAYLDSAAVGLVSTRVTDAMTRVVREHQALGIAASPRWGEHAPGVRADAAQLVGGSAERITFTQNTSTGLALVTNGLDWADTDNVVLPAGEFPSNSYPWRQLRRYGVQVREVPMLDGAAPLDDLAAAVDADTRVVAVSAVQYTSGHRYDLAGVSEVTHRAGALLVVDATQALGALRVDVGTADVDVLAVSAHKWLLGPFGIGFVHLSQAAYELLQPSTLGWLSVQDPFAFTPEAHLADDGRRFESGTENSAGIAGLGATLAIIAELGADRVEAVVLAHADHLCDLLREAGMQVHRSAVPARRSGIVIASRSGIDHTALHAELLAQGVRCSLRGDGLRFSPHYFNDVADLQHAADVVKRVAAAL